MQQGSTSKADMVNYSCTALNAEGGEGEFGGREGERRQRYS